MRQLTGYKGALYSKRDSARNEGLSLRYVWGGSGTGLAAIPVIEQTGAQHEFSEKPLSGLEQHFASEPVARWK